MIGVLLVLTVLAVPATPAAAHDTLLSTKPTNGARVDAGPRQVRLHFDLPVGKRYATVTVTGPDGGRWERGPVRVSGSTVVQELRSLGPAGKYRVAWRIISADGHPVSGRFAFTLTTAGPGSPAPATASATASATGGAGRDQGASGSSTGGAESTGNSAGWLVQTGILVAVVLGLVVLAVGGSALLRRRRSDDA